MDTNQKGDEFDNNRELEMTGEIEKEGKNPGSRKRKMTS